MGQQNIWDAPSCGFGADFPECERKEQTMPMTKHIQALKEIKVLVNEYTFYEFDASVFDLKQRAIDDIIQDANTIVKLMTDDLNTLKEKVDTVLKQFFG